MNFGAVVIAAIEIEKTFNVQHGWTPDEDSLPDRFFEESLDQSGRACRLDRGQLGRMIRVYNLARGWSPDGFPVVESEAIGGNR